jgi:hypothetical protein
MKSAILFTTLSTLAVVDAASHAKSCTAGCAQNSCDAADGDMILSAYDKLVADNTGAAGSTPTANNPAGDAVVLHTPFLCKVTKTRRQLAAHVAGTYRVAVAGAAGSTKALHPMEVRFVL